MAAATPDRPAARDADDDVGRKDFGGAGGRMGHGLSMRRGRRIDGLGPGAGRADGELTHGISGNVAHDPAPRHFADASTSAPPREYRNISPRHNRETGKPRVREMIGPAVKIYED